MAEEVSNASATTVWAAGGLPIGAVTGDVNDASSWPATGSFRLRSGNEILLVGSRVGNALSAIVRAQEGTAAQDHAAGDPVRHTLTAAGLATQIRQANPMSAPGDVIVGGVSGDATALAAGADGDVLTLAAGAPGWAAPAGGGGGFANPMTDPADLIVGGAAGAATRLGKGLDGQVLTVDPATHLLVWADPASGGGGFANPMTTQDDVIVGGVAGAAGRLGIGSAGEFLGVVGGHLGYATPTGGGGGPAGTLGYPFALVPPVLASFTWDNQGGATATVDAEGFLELAVADTADNAHLLYVAAPATPYTITLGLLPAWVTKFQFCGLFFRESSSGKLVGNLFGFDTGGGWMEWRSRKYAAASGGVGGTDYSAQGSLGTTGMFRDPLLLLQIADDGTNRASRWSVDSGRSWQTQHTVARADYLTADQVGFGIIPLDTGGNVFTCRFCHWAAA